MVATKINICMCSMSPYFGLEMIVVMGSSSQKGGNGIKNQQKKNFLEKHDFGPPRTFCYWGLLMCLLKDNPSPFKNPGSTTEYGVISVLQEEGK